MSYRFSAPRHIGGYTFGVGGLGARGDAVSPLPGTHGPGILDGDPVLPAEAADEFMYRVTTRPPLLTVFRYRDRGEVEAEGPDGVHVGVAERRKNGAVYGSKEFYIYIGAVGALNGTVALDDAAASGALATAPPSGLSGAITVDEVAPSGVLAPLPPSSLTGALTTEDATPGGDGMGLIIYGAPRSLVRNAAFRRRPTNLSRS